MIAAGRRLCTTLTIIGVTMSPHIAAAAGSVDSARLAAAVERAGRLPQLHALIVAHEGRPIVERAFRGPGLDVPVNIKSAAKAVIAALVGIAIDRELLDSVDQPIAPLLEDALPPNADSRLGKIAIGHLLSMQAGLERTSGANYGRWVGSANWIRHVLSRPFVDEPGGSMLYSTGNSHLLSAILTRVAGRSTLDLARAWLGEPLDIVIPAWQRDPQGIYFGGNNMALSPRVLLRFGEMDRNGGVYDGRRVVSEAWVRASWTPRTRSRFTGDGHGYGWFIAEAQGHALYYARGYGGQLLYVAPGLALTVVITSDATAPARSGGYFSEIGKLVTDGIVPAIAGSAQ